MVTLQEFIIALLAIAIAIPIGYAMIKSYIYFTRKIYGIDELLEENKKIRKEIKKINNPKNKDTNKFDVEI